MTIDLDIGTRLRAAGHIRDDEDLSVLYDRWLFVQSARGYRFGIDAVVLARYAQAVMESQDGKTPVVLDIGTGCGVAAILLAASMPAAAVTAIEIQPTQVDRARRNVALNGLTCRVFVLEGDIQDFVDLPNSGNIDLIISNPPFYRAGSGRINPDGERAIARHELRLNMSGLMAAIVRLLGPAGHAIVLYPAERLDECLAESTTHGLVADALVPLLPALGAPAESYLINLVHARSG